MSVLIRQSWEKQEINNWKSNDKPLHDCVGRLFYCSKEAGSANLLAANRSLSLRLLSHISYLYQISDLAASSFGCLRLNASPLKRLFLVALSLSIQLSSIPASSATRCTTTTSSNDEYAKYITQPISKAGIIFCI